MSQINGYFFTLWKMISPCFIYGFVTMILFLFVYLYVFVCFFYSSFSSFLYLNSKKISILFAIYIESISQKEIAEFQSVNKMQPICLNSDWMINTQSLEHCHYQEVLGLNAVLNHKLVILIGMWFHHWTMSFGLFQLSWIKPPWPHPYISTVFKRHFPSLCLEKTLSLHPCHSPTYRAMKTWYWSPNKGLSEVIRRSPNVLNVRHAHYWADYLQEHF